MAKLVMMKTATDTFDLNAEKNCVALGKNTVSGLSLL